MHSFTRKFASFLLRVFSQCICKTFSPFYLLYRNSLKKMGLYHISLILINEYIFFKSVYSLHGSPVNIIKIQHKTYDGLCLL